MPVIVSVQMALFIIAAWAAVHLTVGQPHIATGGAIFGLGLFLLGFSTQRGSR
jgi:hypothetical protein